MYLFNRKSAFIPLSDKFNIALVHDPDELNSIPRYLYFKTISTENLLYIKSVLHRWPFQINTIMLVLSVFTSIPHLSQYSPNLSSIVCKPVSVSVINRRSSAYIRQLIEVLSNSELWQSICKNLSSSVVYNWRVRDLMHLPGVLLYYFQRNWIPRDHLVLYMYKYLNTLIQLVEKYPPYIFWKQLIHTSLPPNIVVCLLKINKTYK